MSKYVDLKLFLEQSDTSLRQISKNLKIPFVTLQKINTKVDPRASSLLKIAHELGVNVSDLLIDDNESIKIEKQIHECLIAKYENYNPIWYFGSLEDSKLIIIADIDFEIKEKCFSQKRKILRDQKTILKVLEESRIIFELKDHFYNYNLDEISIILINHCKKNCPICYDLYFNSLLDHIKKNKIIYFSKSASVYLNRIKDKLIKINDFLYSINDTIHSSLIIDGSKLRKKIKYDKYKILLNENKDIYKRFLINSALNCNQLLNYKNNRWPCVCYELLKSTNIRPFFDEVLMPLLWAKTDSADKIILSVKAPSIVAKNPSEVYPRLSEANVDNYDEKIKLLLESHIILRRKAEKFIYVPIVMCPNTLSEASFKTISFNECLNKFFIPRLLYLGEKDIYFTSIPLVKKLSMRNLLKLEKIDEERYYSKYLDKELKLIRHRQIKTQNMD